MFLSFVRRKTFQTLIPFPRHHRLAGNVFSSNTPSPPFRPLSVLLIAICLLTLFAGCAATHVAISKRNLEVSTWMGDAVFLDPVAGDKRTCGCPKYCLSEAVMNIIGAP